MARSHLPFAPLGAALLLAACAPAADSKGTESGDYLVLTAAEPPGQNCEYGGTRVDAGVDANGDGVLDASEQPVTSWICSSDLVPPTVVAVNPDWTETRLSAAASFTVTFSEPMDPATLEGAILFGVANPRFLGASNPLPVTVAWDAATRTATVSPLRQLGTNTPYLLAVGQGARDLAGNALAVPFSQYYFFEVDDVPPAIVALSPPDGGRGSAWGSVAVRFDEALRMVSVAGASFELVDSHHAPVAGTLRSIDYGLEFVPGAPLTPGESYTATLGILAADYSGNSARLDRTWTFTAEIPALAGAPVATPATISPGDAFTIRVPVSPSVRAVTLSLTSPAGTCLLETVPGNYQGEGWVDMTFPVGNWVDPGAGDWVIEVRVHDEWMAGTSEYRWDPVASEGSYIRDGSADSGIPLGTLSILATPLPDLAVAVDSVTGTGATRDVALTVTNTGTLAAPPSAVGLYVDRAAAAYAYPDAWVDVPALDPGATATLTTTLDVLWDVGVVRAVADLAGEVEEADENDNGATGYAGAPAGAVVFTGGGFALPGSASLTVAGAPEAIGGLLVAVDAVFDADLSLMLVSPFPLPDGTTIPLFSVPSGGGSLAGTVFDDGALARVDAGASPFRGRFRPLVSFTPVAGTSPLGTWTLKTLGGGTGTFNSWELVIW